MRQTREATVFVFEFDTQTHLRTAAIARMRFAFERATQIMPNYRLCWQHLADEYRTIRKVAEANRARLLYDRYLLPRQNGRE